MTESAITLFWGILSIDSRRSLTQNNAKRIEQRFEFVTASRIIFGSGTLAEIGALAAEMGKRRDGRTLSGVFTLP